MWIVLAQLATATPVDDGIYIGKSSHQVVVENPHIFATANANTRFTFWGEVSKTLNVHGPYLKVGDQIIKVSSVGSDAMRSTITFELDRQTAEVVASRHGIEIRERTELGRGFSGVFAGGPYRVGEPMPLSVTLRKAGDEDVAMWVGGRNRGPRNNRFSFAVFKDGEQLPELQGWDFGGLMSPRAFADGEELTLEADLASWVEIAEPGEYEVRAGFDMELLVPQENGMGGDWPEHAHEVWERTLTQTLTIQVHGPGPSVGLFVGEPREKVAPSSPHVFSMTNDNSRFLFWTRVDKTVAQRGPRLEVDGEIIAASSTGSGSNQEATATFQLDREAAQTVATFYELPLSERRELGSGLSGTFTGGSYRVGEAMPIALSIEMNGEEDFALWVGGRNRGPRNNRFTFAVFKDGVQLTELEGFDFGGRAYMQTFDDGQTLELQADLSRWVEITEPGTYEIRAGYDMELVIPHDDRQGGGWPDRGHEVWERTLTGDLTIEVR